MSYFSGLLDFYFGALGAKNIARINSVVDRQGAWQQTISKRLSDIERSAASAPKCTESPTTQSRLSGRETPSPPKNVLPSLRVDHSVGINGCGIKIGTAQQFLFPAKRSKVTFHADLVSYMRFALPYRSRYQGIGVAFAPFLPINCDGAPILTSPSPLMRRFDVINTQALTARVIPT